MLGEYILIIKFILEQRNMNSVKFTPVQVLGEMVKWAKRTQEEIVNWPEEGLFDPERCVQL